MLHEAIKQLIAILKEEDVDEIEVRRFWTTIRVAKHRTSRGAQSASAGDLAAAEHAQGMKQPAEYVASGAPDSAADAVAVSAGIENGDQSPITENAREILSPMVGTFYRARSPQMEPFVVEGMTVEVGDVLCVIEAMKLMNEIEADSKCVIRRVLVDDARPVEFGQPLFLVESA